MIDRTEHSKRERRREREEAFAEELHGEDKIRNSKRNCREERAQRH